MEPILQVSPYSFISRVLHLAGGSVAFAFATSFLYAKEASVFVSKAVLPSIYLVSLLTGLFNAHRAKPSAFTNKTAALWYRICVYGKIPLLLCLTPTFGAWAGVWGQAFAAFLFLFLGTNARFIREGQTLRQ